MTQNEFLDAIKKRGATLSPACSAAGITLANSALQNMRAAMLPMFLINMYGVCGGINLGNGYIFGPAEVARGTTYPIPSIIEFNRDMAGIAALRGKTVFGRNDFFWFTFDSFGACYMQDNVMLSELRKYDNPYQAMTDCLLGGKI